MSAKKNNISVFGGYLQFDVRLGDIENNVSRVEAGLAEIAAGSDRISPGIVVLPELWTTGFAYFRLPKQSLETPGILAHLQTLAARYEVNIAGSLPEHHEDNYFNTLYITGPEGTTGAYRKQRLFSPMQEDTFFTAGSEPHPIQTDLGPVGGLVCYDLRFPELLREQTCHGADILVISAQWPAARLEHWRILIQARAIENQMFVVAANRCGTTGDTTFGGHSIIVAPDGSILLEAGDGEECRGAELDLEMIAASRSLFSTIPEGI
jgi:predicted amidohydrolase